MARILVYTSPAVGHLFPALGPATALARRGHDVHVVTLGSEIDRVRGLGLGASAIDPQIESLEMTDYLAKNPVEALERAVDTFTARAPCGYVDLNRAIAAQRPDALIIDGNCYGALTAAEASELPWCAFQPFFTPLPDKLVPPFGPGFKPANGMLGRIRDALFRRLIFGKLEKLMLPPVNALRQSAGLNAVVNVSDFLTRPPRTIYFTIKDLDYPRADWPQSFEMVGPAAWGPEVAAPSWLKNESRPIVLVTCSTEKQGDRVIIERALERLAGTEFFVVATTAAHDPSSFAAPENARVERFAAHGPILERAVATICHGGMGITQKSLAQGVPVCVVPFGRDQHEVARRVANAQAGLRCPVKKFNSSTVARLVEQTKGCTPGAQKIAQAFRTAGGSQRAADVVEELLHTAAQNKDYKAVMFMTAS